jgi:outer membrane murein-binding lipoprotein Lpp
MTESKRYLSWEDRASDEMRKNHELRAEVERLTADRDEWRTKWLALAQASLIIAPDIDCEAITKLRADVEQLTLLLGEMDRASWDLLKERERVLNAEIERLRSKV